MGIPDHLTCLLRNLYTGQEATVITGHGTMNWFQIETGVRQGCILSPCLFSLYAEHIIQNSDLDEMVGWHHQLDGHEFEQAPGVGDGQGSLAHCSPWGRKESYMTE